MTDLDPGSRCEWCGTEYDPADPPPQPPAGPTRPPDPAIGEDAPTHCEWCGAEYPTPDGPVWLFVCVHNAGRSQMAAAFARHLSGGRVRTRSAGSAPAEHINPVAAEAMREVGIDLSDAFPSKLTDDGVREADVVITMGCGDACPFMPGRRYLDWALEDPAGQPIEVVRRIRDDIRGRVLALMRESGVTAG